MHGYLIATLGGVAIGASAVLLLGLNGRIAGISGILSGTANAPTGDRAWRWLFLLGLTAGAGLWSLTLGSDYQVRPLTPLVWLLPAGFLVGLGTRLGSGCTSGHGVCGIARLSPRSLAATATFMLTAVFTTFVVRHIVGAPV